MKGVILISAVLAAAAQLPGQEASHKEVSQTIMVSGVTQTLTVGMADLSKLPQQTVTNTDHAAPVTFEGVLLSDVLALVDTPAGEKFHHTAASYYLVVEARDGYRAVFAWAELDPSFMDRKVYLITKRDGKPLADTEGPFRLLVQDEKRGARSVHMVTALKIKQAD